MTWIAPGYLIWGSVAVLAIAALHLFARRRPPSQELPTARFVPDRALRITSRGIAPSDVLLFLARALAVVAIATAFASPLVRRARARVGRVVVVDRSRAVANIAELRDSVRSVLREGDALVTFDSAAHAAAAADADSIGVSDARGSLTAAMTGASRVAGTRADRADSLELVIVSPLLAEEIDEATPVARHAWSGRARLVRVRARGSDTASYSLDVEPGDDALLASLRLRGVRAAGASVRVRRARPSVADSVWARERGRVLVHWPRSDDRATAWLRRDRVDTVGGVAAGGAVVVAPLLRAWNLAGAGRVTARWVDGEPAAVEHDAGNGCIRDVGIDVDAASDAPLRPEFRRLTTALLAPCGGASAFDARPATDTLVSSLVGAGRLASADAFTAPGRHSPWTAWLLAAALALLALEWALRREPRGAST